MRNLKKIIAPLIILCLVGCTSSTSSYPNSNEVSSNNMGENKGSEDQTVRIDFPELLLQNFLLEHSLTYSDPFSQDYPSAQRIPNLLRYSGNVLYFSSYEDTPFIGKENPSRNPQNVFNKLYSYDILTKVKKDLGDIFSDGFQSGDFLFTKDDFYYYPMRIDESANATLYLNKLSYASHEVENIAEIANGNINVYSGQMSDGTIFFMVRSSTDEKDWQRIYKMQNDRTLEVIYDSEQQDIKELEFSAFSVSDNSIFLLRQTAKEGKLQSEIVEMNASGKLLRKINLPGVEIYADLEYFADKLYVCGDYFFIKWYNCGKDLPYFSAYQVIDGQAAAIEVPENWPCYLLTPRLIENRYLIFSVFPDNMDYAENSYTSHIYLFDTQSNNFIGISFPISETVVFNEMVCNEDGDLIMNIVEFDNSTANGQNTLQKIDFNAIKALLKKQI